MMLVTLRLDAIDFEIISAAAPSAPLAETIHESTPPLADIKTSSAHNAASSFQG